MRTYRQEFKEEAMALAREIGVRNASEKLSVSTKTLYGWLSAQAKMKTNGNEEGLTEKVRRLEKELNESRRANEILKKAMGFLAR